MTTTPSIEVGVEIPPLTVGPFTHIDLIRWAAYQENWLRIHYDREHAGRVLGMRDAVQSGHHRTALIVRAITDWLGDGGRLRRLSVRHVAPVFPGDRLTCGGRVRAVGGQPGGSDGTRTIDVDVWAIADADRTASEGTAVVEVTAGSAGVIQR
jgi:acyl dehydratase